MHIHSNKAVRRDIQFIRHLRIQADVSTSEQCCWNCLWAIMDYECLWCEKDMEEVDFRDLCSSWEGEFVRGRA